MLKEGILCQLIKKFVSFTTKLQKKLYKKSRVIQI